MQTGSLINHLYSRTDSEPPYVGMPATLLMWTDRSPATVVDVNMQKRYVVVQEDDYTRTDSNGYCEQQTYEYARNTEASKHIFRKNKKGQWVLHRLNPQTNRLVKSEGYGLLLGRREKYYDPSF